MRDLRAVAAWLVREVKAAIGFLGEPQLWIALIVGTILWSLAYQAPYTQRIDLGGDLRSGRRYDDEPFLQPKTFNDPEPPDQVFFAGGGPPRRWATDDATIVLPGIGGGRWVVAVRAESGRPDGSAVSSRWDDGTSVSTITVDRQPRTYRLFATTDRSGDLTLHFATPLLTTQTDPRRLGLVMYRVVVEPAGRATLPAARQIALLAASLALAYGLLRRLALGSRPAMAAALGLAALAAALLARERTALTLLAPILPAILGGGYALGIVLDAVARSISPTNDQRPTLTPESSFVIVLVVLALVLRLGGMLHPHARFSDAGLNANNLLSVTLGQIYFTEGLPDDSGGGDAPYPPGQYITLAPAQLLLPPNNQSRLLVLKVGIALWDSLVIGLLWFVLRRGGYGPWVALLGTALYLAPPPLLISLSIGEFANVFGQGLVLPLLALLALRACDLPRPRIFVALLALLMLALLGHLGVTISLLSLLITLGVAWLVRPETRPAALALALAGVVAAVLVGLFYYTPFRDILVARLSSAVPSSAESLGIGEKLAGQVRLLPVLGLHPLALALGATGAPLAALRARQTAFGALMVAWWGGTLLSLGLLLFANQGVRWQPFLYPALCLGAGPALALLWLRGRAGRLVAAAGLAFLIWYGVAFWVARIADYLHL